MRLRRRLRQTGSIAGAGRSSYASAIAQCYDGTLRRKGEGFAAASVWQDAQFWVNSVLPSAEALLPLPPVAQEELRKVLGLIGANVVDAEFALPTAHEQVSDHGTLSPVRERQLATLVDAVVAESLGRDRVAA